MKPLAVQLYCVRDDVAKDVPSTLAAIAKIGYNAIETAGLFTTPVDVWAKSLADNGLQNVGAHIGMHTLLGDAFNATIDTYLEIGCKRLIVPGLGGEYTSSLDGFRLACSRMNEIAERAKPFGVSVAFHNHASEFRPVENKIPMMLMLKCLTSAVEMQWDLGNTESGGYDCIRCVASTPGRVKTPHAKPFKKDDPAALIGEDSINWELAVKTCVEVGGAEWFVIEYENTSKYPAIEGIKLCYNAFRKYWA